ncbi:MAG: DUF3460 family protein [Neisseriaceae bacterium]
MAKNVNYTSELMNFIKDLVKNKPEIKVHRESLQNLWEDKEGDEVVEERNMDQTNLKADSYAYYSYPQKGYH